MNPLSGSCVGSVKRLTREQLHICYKMGQYLAGQGIILSTGAASGADQAFAEGALSAGGKVTLWLPWSSYERTWVHRMQECYPLQVVATSISQCAIDNPGLEKEAYESLRLHPHYDKSWREATEKLQARNYLIAKGTNFMAAFPGTLTQSGGTRHSMRLAKHLGIPVFDVSERYPIINILVDDFKGFVGEVCAG